MNQLNFPIYESTYIFSVNSEPSDRVAKAPNTHCSFHCLISAFNIQQTLWASTFIQHGMTLTNELPRHSMSTICKSNTNTLKSCSNASKLFGCFIIFGLYIIYMISNAVTVFVDIFW